MKNIVLLGHGIGVKIVIESLQSSNVGYQVVAVFTHLFKDHAIDLEILEKRKDLYGDHGYNVFMTPVDYNIPLFESSDINDPSTIDLIASYNPSYIISIGCRSIIRNVLLQRFPKQILNIHTTPLPNYRGAANDSWMILNGEWGKTKYGCLHFIDDGIDTGDIIAKEFYEIPFFSYPIDVFKARKSVYKNLVINGLKKLNSPDFIPERQDNDLTTVFPRLLTSRDGHINFKDWGGDDLIKFIYAFGYPFSGAYCYLGEQQVSILKAEFIEGQNFHPFAYGLIVGKNNNNEYKVAVRGGILLIKKIELNGIEVPQNKFFKLGKYLH
jgi:methionyl-tRNA formyltransferase